MSNYKILKRIFIVMGIDLCVYLFSFPIVYVAIIIVSFFQRDINYNTVYAVGTALSMILLMPVYCYCINKYKGKNNFILSLILATIIFIILLCFIPYNLIPV